MIREASPSDFRRVETFLKEFDRHQGTGFRKVEPAILDGRLARKRIDALSLFEGWESLFTFHRTLALDRHFIRIFSIHTHIQVISRPCWYFMLNLDQPPTRAQGPSTLVAHHPVLIV
ncbi:hypothetical protein PAPYR_11099 [Paratrimastix pyriformis]|uniref:Uncharacterized protein n=1 Tax=Paratrimastix pyriformis TaxID=342808 RepID=A0ABQ8U4I2_9EUKA|nr:hypothetical protein PAPYR_11099 [Paratrimastix pyriformis]